MLYKSADEAKGQAYRVYVTDALKCITENTAGLVGGSAMTLRYFDLLHPEKVDTRTGDEIAADVIKNAGLKVVVNGELA